MKKRCFILACIFALAACKKEDSGINNTDVRGSWRSVSISGGFQQARQDKSRRLEIGDSTFKYWMRDSLALNTTYTIVVHRYNNDTTSYLFFKLKDGTERSYDFINRHLRLDWTAVAVDGESVEYERTSTAK